MQKDKETEGVYRRQGRMLSVRRCGAWQTAGGHSHTVSATSLCCSVEPHTAACLKTELKQSFVFNFLQAFHCFFPPPCPYCLLFSHELHSASRWRPLFCCCSSFLAILFFPFLRSFSFLAHFVLSTSRLHIFVSLVFFSLLLSVILPLPLFSSRLSH